MSELPKKGDILELDIVDAAEDGACFGRLEGGLGVFVRGTLAVGDRVEAEVTKRKRKFLETRLVRVLRESEHRTQPVCSHFGTCGGCKWQHVDTREQLRLKRKLVQDALERLGGFSDIEVEAVVPAEEAYRYRNKVDFTFSNRRYLSPDELGDDALLKAPKDFALGFHAPRMFGKAIDIDECFLASPDMNEALHLVRDFCRTRGLSIYSTHTHEGFLRNLVVRRGQKTGHLMVHLITSAQDDHPIAELSHAVQDAMGDRLTTFVHGVTDRKNLVAFADEQQVLFGPGYIEEELGAYRYRISPSSFFQTNTLQAEVLYQTVAEMSGVDRDSTVYDLYCGAGTISLFLSERVKHVLGLEVIPSAVEDATRNAEANGVSNCTFRAFDMKDLGTMEEDLEAFGRPDVVITDPPRAGMHPKAVKALESMGASRIVYVSCKPASLARDGAALCESGHYRLQRVVPVDMFPQTYHIESVALFTKVME